MTTHKKSRVTIALVLVLVLMMSLIPAAYAAGDVVPGLKLSTDKGSYISPGDTVSFTLDVSNTGDDNWNTVKLTSTLKFVEVDAGTVRIDGATSAYTFTSAGKLTVNLGTVTPGATKRVTFDATVLDSVSSSKISYSFTVSGYNSSNVQRFMAVAATFTPLVHTSAVPVINTVTEGDPTVTGTGVAGAVVTVTLPDGSAHNVTVASGGTWTLNVPTGTTLLEGQIVRAYQTETGKLQSSTVQTTVIANPNYNGEATKTSANLTTTTGNVANIGDTIEYTITATNSSTPSSMWPCVVTDTINEYVTLVANSITVDGQAYPYSYDDSTRVLTVDLGNIAGQTSKELKFRVTVNDNAHNQELGNGANVGGVDVDDPDPPIVIDKSEPPIINEVIETDTVVTGEGVAGAGITVTFPDGTTATGTVGQNNEWTVNVPGNVTLAADDVIYAVQQEPDKDVSDPASTIVQPNPEPIKSLTKTSKNLYNSTGLARPGDTIEYTVIAENTGTPSSVWACEVTDELHAGLTFVEGSVTINGVPAQYSYNSATRVLTVDLGNIYGGQKQELVFQCTINTDGYGQTIENTAKVDDEEAEDPDPPVVISAPPTIDEVVETDPIVTGGGVPNAEITVTFPDGTEVQTTVDGNGEWEVDVPANVTLNPGDEITAVQTEPGKYPSDEVKTIVIADRSVDLFLSEWYWEELLTGADSAQAGDTIVYFAEAWNYGTASSLWEPAVAVIELNPDTTFGGFVRINGRTAAASQYEYDAATHTLTVYLGGIVGGDNVNFSFRARVNDDVPDDIEDLDIVVELHQW